MQKENSRNSLELDEREKVGAWYIGGVLVLILSIVFLASLTHLVLSP